MTWIIRVLANKSRSLLRRTAGVIGVGSGSLPGNKDEKLTEAHEKIAERNQRLKRTRRRLAKKEEEIASLKATITERDHETEVGGMKPENIVWIFGSARTGSTWLASMMGETKEQTVWLEPLVGELFGYLYYVRSGHLKDKPGKHFILGNLHKETWLKSIRYVVLNGAAARFSKLTKDSHLVIKEPNGSIGAPLLMEALPESRMIFLMRDPRDVVASAMDAVREESWGTNQGGNKGWSQDTTTEELNALAERQATRYMQYAGNAKKAYEDHNGRKVLVRYENLRHRTFEELKRIYSTLGIPIDEKQLYHAVEKHSWESIPEQKKGMGKFYRKATPGSWKEDLTSEQVKIVEQTTTPILKEFYGS